MLNESKAKISEVCVAMHRGGGGGGGIFDCILPDVCSLMGKFLVWSAVKRAILVAFLQFTKPGMHQTDQKWDSSDSHDVCSWGSLHSQP